MQLVRKLIAHGLASALDFCAGAFIAAAILYLFHIEIAWAPLIGGLIGLSPDLDLRSQFKNDGSESDHHRSLLHYPLLTLPVAMIAGWALGGLPWAVIAGLSLAAHYLHDMAPPFGGLVVLWPFSHDSFGVHGREKIVGDSFRERFIKTMGHDYWITVYWQKFSTLSVGELTAATAFMIGTMMIGAESSFSWFIFAIMSGAWAGLAFCALTAPKKV